MRVSFIALAVLIVYAAVAVYQNHPDKLYDLIIPAIGMAIFGGAGTRWFNRRAERRRLEANRQFEEEARQRAARPEYSGERGVMAAVAEKNDVKSGAFNIDT